MINIYRYLFVSLKNEVLTLVEQFFLENPYGLKKIEGI